jgi:hypothetical protein
MVDQCNSQPLTDTQVARHANDEAIALYLEKRFKYLEAKVYADAQRLLAEAAAQRNEEERRKAEHDLREKQLRAAYPNGLMCPKCKFGPIDVRGCSDLTTHHNEQVAGGRAISNACPKCKFFTGHVSGWAKWDGILREFGERESEAAQQPSQDAGAPVRAHPALSPAAAQMHGRDSRSALLSVLSTPSPNQASVGLNASASSAATPADDRVCNFLVSVAQCEYSAAINAVLIARQQVGVGANNEQELFDRAYTVLQRGTAAT